MDIRATITWALISLRRKKKPLLILPLICQYQLIFFSVVASSKFEKRIKRILDTRRDLFPPFRIPTRISNSWVLPDQPSTFFGIPDNSVERDGRGLIRAVEPYDVFVTFSGLYATGKRGTCAARNWIDSPHGFYKS